MDRRGNVKTTVVGSYDTPRVRLPWSGTNLAVSGRGLTLTVRLDPRRSFPERFDYLTSAGYLHAVGERARLGYSADRGPRSSSPCLAG